MIEALQDQSTPLQERLRAVARAFSQETKLLIVILQDDMTALEQLEVARRMMPSRDVDLALQHHQQRIAEHRREVQELYQDGLAILLAAIRP